VNKSITLEGFDRSKTILDGDGKGTVINVTASKVNIFEFTIKNGTYGVQFSSTTKNCNVSRNIIMRNSYGIVVSGSNHTLRGNDIRGNTYNFGASGRHDIDISNKVDGKPIHYYVDQQDKTIPLDAGYVGLVHCKNIVVKNLLLRNNVQGVYVEASTNITLLNLGITNNDIGVLFSSTHSSRIENVSVKQPSIGHDAVVLRYSNNNTICNNTLLHDGWIGIALDHSENNTVNDNVIRSTYVHHGTGIYLSGDNNIIAGNEIKDNWNSIIPDCSGCLFYHNNFINNPQGVTSIPTNVNSWNLSREGNYWDDIKGVDNNGDGINDPPCKKWINNNNIDYHPLNETWSSTRVINVTLWRINMPPGNMTYNVTFCSNHVIASRKFKPNWEQGYGLITFNITASTQGFCSVIIPRARLDVPIELKSNGTLIDPKDYDLTINVTHLILHFKYTAGKHMVEIKGYKLGFAIGDINGDGKVSMDDIMIAVQAFGKHYP
jgi:parallel beta-helix repeat protein